MSGEKCDTGPHRCEGLYNSPGAWPLVPDFLPRYAGPKNQVTARTWSNRTYMLVTSRWFRGGGLQEDGRFRRFLVVWSTRVGMTRDNS